MSKFLLALLSIASVSSFASSLDMSTLSCKNNYKITTATTLADVRQNCTIKKQSKSHGMYVVQFKNTATKKNVTCTFDSDETTAKLDTCK